MTVHCYFCDSADVRERNTAYVELPVTNWGKDEEGNLSPVSYDTDVSADWECADVTYPYVCRECGTEQAIHQLVAKEG